MRMSVGLPAQGRHWLACRRRILTRSPDDRDRDSGSPSGLDHHDRRIRPQRPGVFQLRKFSLIGATRISKVGGAYICRNMHYIHSVIHMQLNNARGAYVCYAYISLLIIAYEDVHIIAYKIGYICKNAYTLL